VKVIVGLGNPGDEYARTPHNVGFMVVDRLAVRLEAALRASSKFESRLAGAVYGGEELLLVEPQTFMNNSGRAVGAVLAYRKLTLADLLVVVDDADLPLGSLRLRKQGGSAGHRGMESIAGVLGGTEFSRLRVGIGRRERGGGLVRHVLTAFGRDELDVVKGVVEEATEAVLCFVEQGMDAAMNRFNVRRTVAGEEGETLSGGKV
jgi:PTH1 family peptidyl-tRNA hydrolase